MTPQKDDLEAVRAVAAALEGFDANEQERIIRWAREKLGLSPSPVQLPSLASQQPPPSLPSSAPDSTTSTSSGKDLKTFVTEKNPRKDVQFAATVAYFHRFEAPQTQRKNEIDSDDLQEACRLVNRQRLKHPGQTLRNAHTLGLLDKGGQAGSFAINSVGENLVAMTLPSAGATPGKGAQRKAAKKTKTAKKRRSKKTHE